MLPQELGLDVDLPEHGEIEYPSLGIADAAAMAVVAGNHCDVGVRLTEVHRIADEYPEGLYPSGRRELLHQDLVRVELGRLQIVGLYVYRAQCG